ncbi:MAG: hypothetical protein QOJ52_1685 [Acidimicrobiaceae bacterium]|nr:hypothetical protein [Acidimicrobiaceae bacterium]
MIARQYGHRALLRAAAFAAALAVVQCLVLPEASALTHLQAAATGVHTVPSDTWGVTPTKTSLSYTLVVLTVPPSQYFDVSNTGTRTLVGTTYTLDQSMSGLSLSGITVTLKSCAAAWNTSGSGSCSGGSTTIFGFTGASSSVRGTTAATAPFAVANVLHLQASVSGVGVSVSTLTVAITVSVSSKTPNRDISAVTTTNT